MQFLDPSHAWVSYRPLGQLLNPFARHTSPGCDLLRREHAATAPVDLSQHLAGVGQEVFLFHDAKIRVDKLARMP